MVRKSVDVSSAISDAFVRMDEVSTTTSGSLKNGASVIAIPEALEAKLNEYVARYPNSKSAVMPALYMVQEHMGWLPDEAIRWVAQKLNLPAAHVFGVATFYTMYYKKPVGKYHVQVCRTLSCALCGAAKLTECLRERLGIGPQEVTADGVWSYEEVECLGSCGTAPMVEINDVYFENLTPDSLRSLMDRIEREQPDLRYSALREELGGGLRDCPRSVVWESHKS